MREVLIFVPYSPVMYRQQNWFKFLLRSVCSHTLTTSVSKLFSLWHGWYNSSSNSNRYNCTVCLLVCFRSINHFDVLVHFLDNLSECDYGQTLMATRVERCIITNPHTCKWCSNLNIYVEIWCFMSRTNRMHKTQKPHNCTVNHIGITLIY